MTLDTSFLVDVVTGDRSALSVVDEIEAEQVVPPMTLQELYIGVGASESPERERRKMVVEARPIRPTSEEIARKAGRSDGQRRRDCRRINVGDATIGATGIVRDERVLTGDPDPLRTDPGTQRRELLISERRRGSISLPGLSIRGNRLDSPGRSESPDAQFHRRVPKAYQR